MAYDWASRRATATRMITKYGCRAILRRDSGDRDCTACMVDFLPRSHQGELRNTPDRTFLVVAEGLTVPPDAEKDRLVWLDPDTGAEVENLRLIAPIGKIAPAGVVLYWELQARHR
jgi:hypothetical protein